MATGTEADAALDGGTERYDLVFFSFWLTHVPPSRFEWFWALVERCRRGDLGAVAYTARQLGRAL